MKKPSYRRATEEERRNDLIQATLDCVAEKGLRAATVREVAHRAGVSNGLIRHIFSSKEQMIQESYRSLIFGLTENVKQALKSADTDPVDRLSQFIRASLLPPVVDGRRLSIWATFISYVPIDPEMAKIHREGYLNFRNELDPLVEDVLTAANRKRTAKVVREHSIKINAVIDGLWLEGCLAYDLFEKGELAQIGIEVVENIIGISLKNTNRKKKMLRK